MNDTPRQMLAALTFEQRLCVESNAHDFLARLLGAWQAGATMSDLQDLALSFGVQSVRFGREIERDRAASAARS